MSSSLPQKVLVNLALKSGNRCAFPNCNTKLTADGTANDVSANLGEAAHIVGEKGPRHDPNLPISFLNSVENLVYLCRNHHRLIDSQSATYTVDQIREWKQNHEAWVADELDAELIKVSFYELETVTKGLIARAGTTTRNLDLIKPSEKIEKNALTADSEYLITSALGQAQEVRKFINEMNSLIPNFADSLTERFQQRYVSDYKAGLRADDLFNSLYLFSCNGAASAALQAAGLAVLVYLFEVCEIFEK